MFDDFPAGLFIKAAVTTEEVLSADAVNVKWIRIVATNAASVTIKRPAPAAAYDEAIPLTAGQILELGPARFRDGLAFVADAAVAIAAAYTAH